jgi:hypothetical protein
MYLTGRQIPVSIKSGGEGQQPPKGQFAAISRAARFRLVADIRILVPSRLKGEGLSPGIERPSERFPHILFNPP